jgi:hypothetical protein
MLSIPIRSDSNCRVLHHVALSPHEWREQESQTCIFQTPNSSNELFVEFPKQCMIVLAMLFTVER